MVLEGFSPAVLFLSLVVSGIGFGFFLYGKRQDRIPQLIAGLALMVYPYFVAGAGWMLTIGVLIVAALWLALRYGY